MAPQSQYSAYPDTKFLAQGRFITLESQAGWGGAASGWGRGRPAAGAAAAACGSCRSEEFSGDKASALGWAAKFWLHRLAK